jgi:hypothetical protein
MAKPTHIEHAETLVRLAVALVHHQTTPELKALIEQDMLEQLYARPYSSGVLDPVVMEAARDSRHVRPGV